MKTPVEEYTFLSVSQRYQIPFFVLVFEGKPCFASEAFQHEKIHSFDGFLNNLQNLPTLQRITQLNSKYFSTLSENKHYHIGRMFVE